jgi:hypothetical protein
MREVGELIMPGRSIRSLMRRFRGGGGQAPLVEPGTYTLTLKAGDKAFTQPLVVGRVGTYGSDKPQSGN